MHHSMPGVPSALQQVFDKCVIEGDAGMMAERIG